MSSQWKLLSLRKQRCAGTALGQKDERKKNTLTASLRSKKRERKKDQGSRRRFAWHPLPRTHRGPGFADVTGRGSLFSLHLSVEEYKFIIQPGTGRSPLPLLSSIYRLALGYFSCMVDILLNTSFLDDMGDHSKSKLFLFLLLYFYSGGLLLVFYVTFMS